MKKKLILIPVLVLALMASIGIPVVAGSSSAITLTSEGDGIAEWSTEVVPISGNYSAKLSVVNGVADWAEVSIPIDIALKDINTLTFWKKVIEGYCGWNPEGYPGGWNPNIVLAIDADNDGDFDGDIPSYHTGGGIGSDAFVEGEFRVGLTEHDSTFTFVNALTDMVWWGADTDGVVNRPCGPLSGFQTQSWGAINPTDHIKFIKIVIGGAGSWMDETAYVDMVTINGNTYDLEQPPAISKKDPNRFTVLMPFGRDNARYVDEDDNALRNGTEVIGLYDDVGYKLVILKGCVIERLSGKRLNCLYLKAIDGSVLTFTTGNDDVEFSEPCVLYTTEGEVYRNMWGKLVTDSEWVEVGSFTSIVDREAHLD